MDRSPRLGDSSWLDILNTLAVPARKESNDSYGLELIRPEWRPIVRRAAELYGLAYSRKQIAHAIKDELYKGRTWPADVRYKNARNRLKKWEGEKWFRDLVYQKSVVELDMQTPAILRGVAHAAKRGRVDAAKLSLAITGRYVEKSDNQPATVTINLQTIPRPQRQAVRAEDDVVVEDAEWDED